MTIVTQREQEATTYTEKPALSLADVWALHNATQPVSSLKYWIDDISIDIEAEYETNTPEWLAQQRARFQLRNGPLGVGVDKYQEIFRKKAEERKQLEQGIVPPGREQEKVNTVEEGTKPTTRALRPFTPTHGVLSHELLYMAVPHEGRKPTPVTHSVSDNSFTHVGDIYEIARKYNLSSVWLLPENELTEKITYDFVEATPEAYHVTPYPREQTDGLPVFLKIWKKGDKTVYVWVTQNETRWGDDLAFTTNALILYAAILYVEHALDTHLLYSPGYSGRELMKSHNTGKRAQWIQGCNHEGIPYEVVNDLGWKRALTPEERECKHLLAVDKVSAYLGVCSSINLGEGTPVHEKNPTFDRKLPGLWSITLAGSSPYNGVTLPHPTNGKTSGWFLTFTVQNALECGYVVTVHEGYIWHVYHQTLRSWSDTVWNARQALREHSELYSNDEARKLAYGMVKRIATQSVGWLDLRKYGRGQGDEEEQEAREQVAEETGDNWNRPDFRRGIVEEAKHRMFAQIRKLVEAGYIPVGVDVDALYFATDEVTPEAMIAPITDLSPTTRGGYRHKYTVPLADVLPLFDSKMKMHSINTAIIKKFSLED